MKTKHTTNVRIPYQNIMTGQKEVYSINKMLPEIVNRGR